MNVEEKIVEKPSEGVDGSAADATIETKEGAVENEEKEPEEKVIRRV